MRINYFGTDVRETFRATETTRETFWGMGGNDTFHFFNGDVDSGYPDPDFSDRFIGGDGDDLMQGLYVGMHDYDTYDLLSFDGGDGYDTVRYDVFGTLPDAGTSIVDLGRFSTLERSVEHHLFNMHVGADTDTLGVLGINGTTGDETVNLYLYRTLAETSQVVEIDVALDNGKDTFTFVGTPRVNTKLLVRTGSGEDLVIINDTSTVNSDIKGSQIKTGAGQDVVVLDGMHKETVNLGSGNDSIYLLTGGFADVPDFVTTGKGADRIYMELDEYSRLARVTDFDAIRDVVVFDNAEFRDTSVTFDRDEWQTSTDPRLYMDNAAGKLWFGNNVMASFTNGAILTAANFETDDFLF